MRPYAIVGAPTCRAHLAEGNQIVPHRIHLARIVRLLPAFLILLAGSLAPCPSCLAAPVASVDLGQNLTYVRVHRLPDDDALVATAWKAAALIIDLRHVSGDPVASFSADLAARPALNPLFVLTGPETPSGLIATFRRRAPALITIGLSGPGNAPGLAIAVSPEIDRQAYDAVEAGKSVESLISEQVAKPRFDEAALARDHTSAVAGDDGDQSRTDEPKAVPPPDHSPAPAAGATPSPAATEVPPKDAVLQRAVQLHRALLALGKLPPG